MARLCALQSRYVWRWFTSKDGELRPTGKPSFYAVRLHGGLPLEIRFGF
jgi:hypothetical protein